MTHASDRTRDISTPGPCRPFAYPRIQDLAAIGNCHSVALISSAGSIDWWCPARFDERSVFAALLDKERGGRFLIRPLQPARVRRRYVGATNVLETCFVTDTGTVRLTDLMPLASGETPTLGFPPRHAILRVVEALDGEVDVEALYMPRFDYGTVAPRIRDRGALGFVCQHRADALALRSELPLLLCPDGHALYGRAVLRPGMRYRVALTFARGEPLIIPPLGAAADVQVAETLRWWESWASRCCCEGPFAEAIVRSALTLKLMAYAPSGAIVAAPTTSLPEQIGGVRNWDYRYCWLRDASMTMRALLDVGHVHEGRAFLEWLLHATRLTWPELQVLYDVFGRTRLAEHVLDHLQGYEESRPVRIGNAAAEQFQLDIYGEVVGAAAAVVRQGHTLKAQERRLLRALGRTVCRRWREPDEGLWEVRSARRHHTHSKMMCWVALDRLLGLAAAGHIKLPVETFTKERDAIRTAIESRAYNHAIQSYASVLDGDEVDASLLTMALQGYVDPAAPRMRATYRRIRERLGVNGLLRRYPPGHDDGLPGSDAAFGICSFWSVHYRALAGELDEAAAEFTQVLSFANDVGLFAEEIEPVTGEARGNFPQAFTHIGVINAGLALSRGAEARRKTADWPRRGTEIDDRP